MDGATGLVTASRILGDQVGSTAPVFLAFLAVHVMAGLTAVITGAVAAVARKGSPRHIRAGRWFYGAITVLFATATAPVTTAVSPAMTCTARKARNTGAVEPTWSPRMRLAVTRPVAPSMSECSLS